MVPRLALAGEGPDSSRRGGPSDRAEWPPAVAASSQHVPVPQAPRIRYALIGSVQYRATARNETISGGHDLSSVPSASRPLRVDELRVTSGYKEASFGAELEMHRTRVNLQSIWRGSEFLAGPARRLADTNRYFTFSVAYRLN